MVRKLYDDRAGLLDTALVLWLPGPRTATGEDCAEFHCHGGRAVVAGVLDALRALPGLRDAEPGEFTRRAFTNGRLDLAQAEALGDLLTAETRLQREAAHSGFGGRLSREVAAWRDEVLRLSAAVEAVLDFAEEDGITTIPGEVYDGAQRLAGTLSEVLGAPRSERLRDGIRVVLAGPPNSGKSSLFNRLIGDSAAIVTAQPGTTRDVLERSVAWDGIPFVLIDTAGLRNTPADEVEGIGIARAEAQIERGDLVLWLGEEGGGPPHAIEVQSRIDDSLAPRKRNPTHRISSVSGEGLADLIQDLITRARDLLPSPTSLMVNQRQAALLTDAHDALIVLDGDPLLCAESLRCARLAFDRLLGNAGTENMLDQLFMRFCIGK